MNLLNADPDVRGGRPKITHQGTFNGNPVSMAAGLAMLAEIERIDGCATATALGDLARAKLNALSEQENLPFYWYGSFSVCHMLVRPRSDQTDVLELPLETLLAKPQPLLSRLRMGLNLLGVDVNSKCSMIFSALHQPEDIDCLVGRIAAAAEMVRSEGLLDDYR